MFLTTNRRAHIRLLKDQGVPEVQDTLAPVANHPSQMSRLARTRPNLAAIPVLSHRSLTLLEGGLRLRQEGARITNLQWADSLLR